MEAPAVALPMGRTSHYPPGEPGGESPYFESSPCGAAVRTALRALLCAAGLPSADRSTGMDARRHAAAAMAVLASLAMPGSAPALEGGQSYYLKGYRDFMAGALQAPGVVLRNDVVTYQGSEQSSTRTGRLSVDQRFSSEVFGITVVTPYRILGGHYAFAARVAGSRVEAERTVTTALGRNYREGMFTGFNDPVISPLVVGWHAGKLHWNFATAVWIPVGSYDTTRMVNTSKNYWAWSPQFGATYFDPATGLDLSAAAIYVFNYENPETRYKSGDTFHFDFAVGRYVLPNVTLGAVGYMMQQMSDDEGAGNTLGPRRARVFGVGPGLKVVTKNGDTPVTFVAKYYREFSAENTTEGHSATLSVRANF